MGKKKKLSAKRRDAISTRVANAISNRVRVGDGMVDPDFDDVSGAERDAVEGVMGHGRGEDYD